MSEKIVHIHAKCDAFEFFENVKESKSVSRLRTIRNSFQKIHYLKPKGTLVVKTRIVNPELQFH